MSTSTASAPRARGDGPRGRGRWQVRMECSPRTRGWSQDREQRHPRDPVLPAHAGMVPMTKDDAIPEPGAPRARGDGPSPSWPSRAAALCSPRTRGWSLFTAPHRSAGAVLPAHAGMVQQLRPGVGGGRRAPRARGDGPMIRSRYGPDAPCSPRTRGWSRGRARMPTPEEVLPAHAGMVPGRGRTGSPSPCASRARGDGPMDARRRGLRGPVLPAHAGMVPTAGPAMRLSCRAPRARGDGPAWSGLWGSEFRCSPRTRGWSRQQTHGAARALVLPAHAGMVQGEPYQAQVDTGCSPRTRGWSLGVRIVGEFVDVLPAHAGMVPCQPSPAPSDPGAPRARGDGPLSAIARPLRSGCSPRTRGWSRLHDLWPGPDVVLPAHAGMVPSRTPAAVAWQCAPRARGDGPTCVASHRPIGRCSPRTRGWSLALPEPPDAALVLPAHAGMVPTARCRASPRARAPRARGDGPVVQTQRIAVPTCSPRTRGWSQR